MRKTEINKRREYREQIAIAIQNSLSSKYRVSICDFDKTALEIHCTEKQFYSICEEYGCSGIYSDKKNVAIITNFMMYKRKSN